MAMTINGTSGLTFPDTSTQSAAGIGYGQSWQAVSRVNGVTYTNSTGRPIEFAFNGYSTSGNIYVGVSFNSGIYIYFAYSILKSGYAECGGTIIIPQGATYIFSGLPPNLNGTWELR